MRFLSRIITPPGLDTLVMLLVGWSLADVSAVAYATNSALGIAFGFAGLASFFVAWRQWRRSVK
jgi:hypothetical protein